MDIRILRLIATVIEVCEPPRAPGPGHPPAETIRVLKTGVVDVTETYGGYVAGELPMIEILEIPGIFPNPEIAKKAILAWKPHEAKILEEKANAVLLAMAVYPDQAIWSKKSLRKLEDFKGLKIRVHSVALSSLVAGLGVALVIVGARGSHR